MKRFCPYEIRSVLHSTAIAAVVATTVLCAPRASWAGPTDEERAGARAAAYAGVDAFDAGRWQEALDYFERAETIIQSPVHLVYIGRARVELGQLVLAREAFLKILRQEAESDVARSARATAESELEQLEPRIPTLTVEVRGAEGREFEVTIDGKRLAPALVGIPSPVDPGARTVAVTAGEARAEEIVSIEEGAKESLSLQLPAPRERVSQAESTDAAASSPDGGASPLRIGSYVALGVGAAGLGAGTFFALRASGKSNEASDLCERETGSSSCAGLVRNDPTARSVRDLDDEASRAHTFSVIGFVAGGVGVATGVTLFILSLDKADRPKSSTRRLTPLVGHNYVGLRGTF